MFVQEAEKSIGVNVRWDAAKRPSIVYKCFQLVFGVLSGIEWLKKVNQTQIIHSRLASTVTPNGGQISHVQRSIRFGYARLDGDLQSLSQPTDPALTRIRLR